MMVILTQPVEIALRSLDEQDRQKVTTAIDQLSSWEKHPASRKQAKPVSAAENVYVLKTRGGDFRVFFRPEHDRIVVLDIATKDTIMAFGHASGSGQR